MEVYERWVKGTLYVGDVMSKPVWTAPESSSIPNIVRIMARCGIGCIVVTKRGKPVGIITEGDILQRCTAASCDLMTTSAGELMSSPLTTIGEDATIDAAARLMTMNSIKRLPVLREAKLVGIITATDIVRKEPVLIRLLDEIARSKRQSSSILS